MVDHVATIYHQSHLQMAMSEFFLCFSFVVTALWMDVLDLFSSERCVWIPLSMPLDVFFFSPILLSSLPLMSVYNRYAGTISFSFLLSFFFIPPIVSLTRRFRFHDGFMQVFKNVLERPHLSR